jgi:CBS domain-containing protein
MMNVAEVMTPDVELADPNMTMRDVAALMRKGDVGALPVGENDRLVGMVTDRDLALRGIGGDQRAENTAVRDLMSGGIYYCFDDQSLDEAGRIMAEHQVHRLPVVNRDKRLVGMVALADLARSGSDGEQAALSAIKGISEQTGEPRR